MKKRRSFRRFLRLSFKSLFFAGEGGALKIQRNTAAFSVATVMPKRFQPAFRHLLLPPLCLCSYAGYSRRCGHPEANLPPEGRGKGEIQARLSVMCCAHLYPNMVRTGRALLRREN